ncbi:hypothetical protein OH77DRAFT_1214391 [Trametes cingulata]|nr:hypothetical protein OH77DRAFT_1214391 [Trametes cingulata]
MGTSAQIGDTMEARGQGTSPNVWEVQYWQLCSLHRCFIRRRPTSRHAIRSAPRLSQPDLYSSPSVYAIQVRYPVARARLQVSKDCPVHVRSTRQPRYASRFVVPRMCTSQTHSASCPGCALRGWMTSTGGGAVSPFDSRQTRYLCHSVSISPAQGSSGRRHLRRMLRRIERKRGSHMNPLEILRC